MIHTLEPRRGTVQQHFLQRQIKTRGEEDRDHRRRQLKTAHRRRQLKVDIFIHTRTHISFNVELCPVLSLPSPNQIYIYPWTVEIYIYRKFKIVPPYQDFPYIMLISAPFIIYQDVLLILIGVVFRFRLSVIFDNVKNWTFYVLVHIGDLYKILARFGYLGVYVSYCWFIWIHSTR